ncbi:MAG: hypothetical protein ACUVT7_05475 [Thermoplasmata archaeon]
MANAILDAAGYDRRNADGGRLVNRTDNPYASYGTPLSFKFMVGNDAPYIKEMWEKIGVSVDILPVDESAMENEIMWAAAHDVFMWCWSGDFDPTYILAVHTTDQIWGWSDTFWSNETYDRLFLLQMQQTGEERRQTVFEMQRIWYEAPPMIIITYPYDLFAWSTLNFTKWGDPVAHLGRTMMPYFGANPLFLGLQPVGGGGGGPSGMVLVGAGVTAALVVAAAVFMAKRRRTKEQSGVE